MERTAAANSAIYGPIMAIFRISGRFFRSEYAAFGLRATTAAFIGSLPAFIRSSAEFYLQYRGVWAIVAVVLCMSPTAGASFWNLAVQISGSLVGGLLAMAVWYMVDQKVAGVIVLTFVVNVVRMLCFLFRMTIDYYFLIQDPRRVFSFSHRRLMIDPSHFEFLYHISHNHWLRSRGVLLLYFINRRLPK
jgi:Fusaric acid resistance protein-like